MEYELSLDCVKPSIIYRYELTLDGIVVGKGTLGFRGNGIKDVSSIPSTEDEGENTVTITDDDGRTFTFKVRNGSRGNGITSVDVVPSSVDAGANKVTLNFTDGDSKEFLVYNGHTGTAAGFGTPTISIDDTYGTPTASVSATGPDTAKVFHIDLMHLKGNGIESMDYTPSYADGGANTMVFTLSDGTKKTVQTLNGSKGGKGDTGDPFSVAKVYSSIAEMEAGYATDGVAVGGFVVIDTGDVEDEDNAKLFVKGDTQYDYLTDMSGAQGIQGPRGVGISSIEQTTTSTASEGVNEATIALTDGTSYKIRYRNGAKGDKGTSISKVEQTTKSTADSGTNVLKITLDDGTSSEFEVRNGSKGDTPTKEDIGLGNVDNTSDADKPISTSMQQALDAEATARQNADTSMLKGLDDRVLKTDYPFSIDADGRLNITYEEE